MPDIAPHIRTDFKSVDKRDPVSDVMGWVTGDTDKLPVIMDGGRPVGIVNERALMGRRIDLRAKVETYTLTTRALTAESSLDEAMARMAEFRAAHLPVETKKGTIAGFVSAIDLVRLNGVERAASEVCVPVTTLREGQTLGEAMHAFHKEYVDFLPVVGADGKLSGVLARRELLRIESNGGARGRKDANGEKLNILNDPIDGFLESAVSTVQPGARVGAVLDIIEDQGYAIVQGKDGALMGIITPETLVRRS